VPASLPPSNAAFAFTACSTTAPRPVSNPSGGFAPANCAMPASVRSTSSKIDDSSFCIWPAIVESIN
jgi:hypothetical protein